MKVERYMEAKLLLLRVRTASEVGRLIVMAVALGILIDHLY